MAAFLSNDVPAVILKPLQHIANLHREDADGCLMRLLYGLPDARGKSSGTPAQSLDLPEPIVDSVPTGRRQGRHIMYYASGCR